MAGYIRDYTAGEWTHHEKFTLPMRHLSSHSCFTKYPCYVEIYFRFDLSLGEDGFYSLR